MIFNIVHKAYRRVKEAIRINYIATGYINLRLLSLKNAYRCPILCYGKIKFHHLKGRIIIDGPIKTGMIKIGYRWLDLWPVSYIPTQINFIGVVKFYGTATLSGGVSLNVQSREGIIEFGDNIRIGGGTMIKAMQYIYIGHRTRVTGNCCIMDSNMHYVKDISTGRIPTMTGNIYIGNNCWINYGSVITKGAFIPDYSITARNTLVGKNYKNEGSNLFLAGSPAKIINKSVQRIFNYDREDELRRFFKKNGSIVFFQDKIGLKEENIPFDTNE